MIEYSASPGLSSSPLPLAEVLRIGREMADGLTAAHARGACASRREAGHVWLESPSGRVKLLDFGLARAVAAEGAAGEPQLTLAGGVVGTPAYMAPEQARRQAVDARCDLFSLGCVLYRMCTGVLPFVGRDSLSTLLAVTTHEPRSPLKLDPTLPPALCELVMHSAWRNRQHRVRRSGQGVRYS